MGGDSLARPQKTGLDYFPLDVDIDQDDKIQLIEARFGITGFGIIIKLFMKIYKEGYFYEWTEKEQLLFSKRINVDINLVNDVINECIKWGLFDSTLYEKYKILTSKGIQRRYLEATGRRKQVEMIEEYCLIDSSKYSNIIFVSINSVNVNNNPQSDKVNDGINPQSKVKESKVKERKVVVNNDLPPQLYDENLKRLSKAYEDNGFGILYPNQAEVLLEFAEQYTTEWVIMALKKAANMGKRTLAYVKGILKGWQSDGQPNMEIGEAKSRDQPTQSYFKPFNFDL